MLDLEVKEDWIMWLGISDKRLWPLLRENSCQWVVRVEQDDMKSNYCFLYNSKMSLLRKDYLKDLIDLNLDRT